MLVVLEGCGRVGWSLWIIDWYVYMYGIVYEKRKFEHRHVG